MNYNPNMTEAEKNRLVDNFNAKNPVGKLVTVELDDGRLMETKVKAPAELLGGHTPVVWLAAITGCYLLTRVKG